MPYLIGVDEAGYGPNLGPLIVTGTLWWVPGEANHGDARLAEVASAETSTGGASDDRMVIADSKVLYQSGHGLAALERSVLAAVSVASELPAQWRNLWRDLAPDAKLDAVPWYAGFNEPLPLAAREEHVRAVARRFAEDLRAAGARLVAIRSRAVLPAEFNRLIDSYGNKASALTKVSIELLAHLAGLCGDDALLAVCDKHGGRNRYAGYLQQQFSQWWVDIRKESREESVYRLGPSPRQVEFRFRARAERFTPTGLASMVSKYLRETAMWAFNRFWSARVENLRSTAGYPLDARRFHDDIRATQFELGIDDNVLWRSR